ncbi:YaiI/YqxD family protein [Larsenimonas suaedae]|uniref:UPF0178 protein QC825_04225 n=1 Tax=Larsenimonas suaedae TaxID=1851019 RepID=A0ABU1GTC6_9GAMM|nr:YaiI/YqxD family protein [Larsenimonas suaedae]MCM2971731.1 YaiI/YqxD family protein [Larsenimonas suaedae]MDR5895283.1 YaiI/YqxD family protein [Larsenimonas suaedae]
MPYIWIDADACPKAIRDIVVRGAERTGYHAYFVANHALPLPKRHCLTMISVPGGADAADNVIIERAEQHDLVVTSDLPLADAVIAKGAQVMTSRGEALTTNNIKARLNMRDFMETLRASGEHTGGPSGMSAADVRDFANAFDKVLTHWRTSTA